MRKDRMIEDVLGDEALLSPSELYDTSFKNALVGGYDKEEVNDYLERVADTMEKLMHRVRSLKDELDAQRTKMDEIRDMESTLRNALITSQKFGENIEEASRLEAQAILKMAHAERDSIVQAARQLPDDLGREIEALRTERDRLRADMRAVLAAHSALLMEIPTAEAVQRIIQEQAEGFREAYGENPPQFDREVES